MKFVNQLLSNKGIVSAMRVMSLLSLATAIAIAFYGMSKAVIDYSGLTLLCSAFLTASFGGKVMQKRTEVTADNDRD